MPCNFLYCGQTSPTEKFRRPDGKVFDARNVHLLTRDRRFGRLRYKRTRAEQKQILIAQGCEFFKDDGCKHRFVGIFGDRRIKRIIRAALRWEVLAYPKREPSPEDRVQVVDLDPVPKIAFACCICSLAQGIRARPRGTGAGRLSPNGSPARTMSVPQALTAPA